jgi:hypothetical protein
VQDCHVQSGRFSNKRMAAAMIAYLLSKLPCLWRGLCR